MTFSIRTSTVLAAVAMLVYAGGATAAEVPVEVQMPIFANIWKLDRNFKPAHSYITVAVLFQENNVHSKAARAAAFKWAASIGGMRFVAVTMDHNDWTAVLNSVDADVFYVTEMRGVDTAAIASIARRRGIRTMAAGRDYLPLGLSVAISVRNDRPLIVINLQAAIAEGAAYQAQLLKLADIVQR